MARGVIAVPPGISPPFILPRLWLFSLSTFLWSVLTVYQGNLVKRALVSQPVHSLEEPGVEGGRGFQVGV